MNDDRDARIRDRAYARWETEGRPDGHAIRHWLNAERELANEDESPTTTQGISNRLIAEESEQQRHVSPRLTRTGGRDE
jgi:hypothetical protein